MEMQEKMNDAMCARMHEKGAGLLEIVAIAGLTPIFVLALTLEKAQRIDDYLIHKYNNIKEKYFGRQ
jgi:hypothetical protein